MTSYSITDRLANSSDTIKLDKTSIDKIVLGVPLYGSYLEIDYNGHKEIVKFIRSGDNCDEIVVKRGEFNTEQLNFPCGSCISFYTPQFCDNEDVLNPAIQKIKNFLIDIINWFKKVLSKFYCWLRDIFFHIYNWLADLWNRFKCFVKRIFWIIIDAIDYFIDLFFRGWDRIVYSIRNAWYEFKSITKSVWGEIKHIIVFFTNKLDCNFNKLRISFDSLSTIIARVIDNQATNILTGTGNFFDSLGPALQKIASDIGAGISNWIGDLMKNIGNIIDWISQNISKLIPNIGK